MMQRKTTNADRRRRRAPPPLFGNESRDDRLDRLLHDRDPLLRLYVYRMKGGRKIPLPPCPFAPGLLTHLRDSFGSGEYWIMIRRGKQMELSGVVGILAPIGWKPPG